MKIETKTKLQFRVFDRKFISKVLKNVLPGSLSISDEDIRLANLSKFTISKLKKQIILLKFVISHIPKFYFFSLQPSKFSIFMLLMIKFSILQTFKFQKIKFGTSRKSIYNVSKVRYIGFTKFSKKQIARFTKHVCRKCSQMFSFIV